MTAPVVIKTVCTRDVRFDLQAIQYLADGSVGREIEALIADSGSSPPVQFKADLSLFESHITMQPSGLYRICLSIEGG